MKDVFSAWNPSAFVAGFGDDLLFIAQYVSGTFRLGPIARAVGYFIMAALLGCALAYPGGVAGTWLAVLILYSIFAVQQQTAVLIGAIVGMTGGFLCGAVFTYKLAQAKREGGGSKF